jgi:hypothetical protein
LQGLQELGWATDRNIQIDYRWAAGQDELNRPGFVGGHLI